MAINSQMLFNRATAGTEISLKGRGQYFMMFLNGGVAAIAKGAQLGNHMKPEFIINGLVNLLQV